MALLVIICGRCLYEVQESILPRFNFAICIKNLQKLYKWLQKQAGYLLRYWSCHGHSSQQLLLF